MNFWVGVSAIAGALRRHVWIDQHYFTWHCNMYIVLVAPPGIVAKSTTSDTAMGLLREVPGIHFGPSVVTWQALVTAFAGAAEAFQVGGTNYVQSPMTINSSEFGNLVDPRNKELVDMLVHLFDGKPFTKATKNSGTDEVVNPWLNIIGCTTPDWIAGSFPEYMIGGGFTSRCLFVYADQKAQYVPYPGEVVPDGIDAKRVALIHDLEHIAVKLRGEYRMSLDALRWGTDWYRQHYSVDIKTMDQTRFGGYMARKQTHAHKVAMILAASKRDELVIEEEDISTAVDMLNDLEPDMHLVFDKIGMTAEAVQSDRFTALVHQRGRIPYGEAVNWLRRYFPHKTTIEDIINAGSAGGLYHFESAGPNGPHWLVAGTREERQPRAPVVPIARSQ
jgi:hypothetical protein